MITNKPPKATKYRRYSLIKNSRYFSSFGGKIFAVVVSFCISTFQNSDSAHTHIGGNHCIFLIPFLKSQISAVPQMASSSSRIIRPARSRQRLVTLKKQIANLFPLQHMPEVQQRGGVRDVLFKKADPHELPHGIAVVYGLLHTLVEQVEPALQRYIRIVVSISMGGRPHFPPG